MITDSDRTDDQTPKKGKMPKKLKSDEARGGREYLTESEVKALLASAKNTGRNTHRNYCLILIMFRHGLRVGETVALKWADVDFDGSSIFIRRLKKGNSATHPLTGDELRALRKLKRETESSYIFMSELGSPLSVYAVRKIVTELGILAGIPIPIHPHMLRHACGYYLANKGLDTRLIQDYLGHRNIQHTVRYTQLAPNKFEKLWDG